MRLFLLVFLITICQGRKQSNNDLEKYVAASTEDISRVFDLEKELFKLVKQYEVREASDEDITIIETFLDNTKLDHVIEEDSLIHVSDPFHAYHCLKRTTSLWEKFIHKLSKQKKLKKAKQILRRLPEFEDFEEGAAFGLLSIQHYYNISIKNIILGNIFSSSSVLSSLDVDDVLRVSRVARYVQRLDKRVEWLRAGVETCGHDCDRLRSELRRAEQEHDQELMTHGLGHVTSDTPDGLPQVPVFTFPAPVNDVEHSEKYLTSLKRFNKEKRLVRVGHNIKSLEQPTEMKFLSSTFHRMWYYGHNTTRDLCSGNSVVKTRGSENCSFLHYYDSYLRLGPFKYEQLSSDPHVGMFRDFFSTRECDSVVNRSRGRIRSTSYEARGRTKYYTTQRVSKRVHYTEQQFDLMGEASDRVSRATNWIVHQEKHASDEYNVINYGLGGEVQEHFSHTATEIYSGQIEVHVDYWNTDNKRQGGARTATFLGYLTHVDQGGRTVFPGLGLSVTPEKGSALFWLTINTEEDYDSRMYHMGCPVARGNKWVLTKWIYSDSQMWRHRLICSN